jgi:tetratricopeptide (TPR) repeat protein
VAFVSFKKGLLPLAANEVCATLSFAQSFVFDAGMNVAVNILKCGLVLFPLFASLEARAEGVSFTNALHQADLAKKRGDISETLKHYNDAQQAGAGSAAEMCVLSRRYCDLTYFTNSTEVQKTFVADALACSQQAVKVDPQNALAHASLAVCYAKSCIFSDIKTELAYSRLFKDEAEKTITLDPQQDVAYYLLGRWNYSIAGAGFFARTYVKIIYGGLPRASFQDAVVNFKKAVALAPNRILNHAGLAMAYEATGEKKLEIAELEKCCALSPLGPEDIEARRDAQNKLALLKE